MTDSQEIVEPAQGGCWFCRSWCSPSVDGIVQKVKAQLKVCAPV